MRLVYKSLEADSCANLYHFGKIVEALQKALDYTFMDELGSNPQCFVASMLPYVHEPGVVCISYKLYYLYSVLYLPFGLICVLCFDIDAVDKTPSFIEC